MENVYRTVLLESADGMQVVRVDSFVKVIEDKEKLEISTKQTATIRVYCLTRYIPIFRRLWLCFLILCGKGVPVEKVILDRDGLMKLHVFVRDNIT